MPSNIANIISMLIPQVIAALSMYKLAGLIFKNRTITILLTFFYTYSIYAQFMSGWPVHSGSIVYAVLPFYIYKFLQIEKSNLYNTLAQITLSSALLIGVNFTYIAYVLISVFFVCIYRLLIDFKLNIKLICLSYSTLLVGYLLVNAVFFGTFISQTLLDKSLLSNSLASESIDWKSSGSDLPEVLREMGSVNFIYEYKGVFAYPNARPFFTEPILIALSYAPIFIFMVAMLLNSKTKQEATAKLTVAILLVISLFLALGVNSTSPFAPIYRFMAENIPYFKVFRDSYKATVVIHLIYTLAIGYVGYWLINYKSKLKHLASIYFVFVITSIAVLSSTYWQGKFFEAETINIPTYWDKMSLEYNAANNGNRILMTPKMEFPVYVFVNKLTGHSTFYRPFFNFNMINPNSVFRYADTTNQIYKTINQETLGLYNVPLVLNQYDVHWRLYNSNNPSQVSHMLEQNGYTLLNRYE